VVQLPAAVIAQLHRIQANARGLRDVRRVDAALEHDLSGPRLP
jgi:hypothetical protein